MWSKRGRDEKIISQIIHAVSSANICDKSIRFSISDHSYNRIIFRVNFLDFKTKMPGLEGSLISPFVNDSLRRSICFYLLRMNAKKSYVMSSSQKPKRSKKIYIVARQKKLQRRKDWQKRRGKEKTWKKKLKQKIY